MPAIRLRADEVRKRRRGDRLTVALMGRLSWSACGPLADLPVCAAIFSVLSGVLAMADGSFTRLILPHRCSPSALCRRRAPSRRRFLRAGAPGE